ncbi:MAG TPA: hypothetical protein VFN75_09665, partial [Pseudonocardiaceae bacterium]|nr:hypothetical protein [Pseudonocardiaceae bacterium]
MNYSTRHKTLARIRGSASNHLCPCGSKAGEWAQVHGTEGSDYDNDYVAMCVPCHRKYDVAN